MTACGFDGYLFATFKSLWEPDLMHFDDHQVMLVMENTHNFTQTRLETAYKEFDIAQTQPQT